MIEKISEAGIDKLIDKLEGTDTPVSEVLIKLNLRHFNPVDVERRLSYYSFAICEMCGWWQQGIVGDYCEGCR